MKLVKRPLSKSDLAAQALVTLDAFEAVDPRARGLLSPIRANVVHHAKSEGRKFRKTTRDWPGFEKDLAEGADDTYLATVSIKQITDEIGIPERLWEHVEGTWRKAFKSGFTAARNEREARKFHAARKASPKKTASQLDREIAEALTRIRRAR
jgi:hypothetical protein